MEYLNRQLKNLGSQRKVSVSAPYRSKPNLVFKAPTYTFRDSRNLSTRQGGMQYLAAMGLAFIFLALTVKVLRVRTRIDILCRIYRSFKNIHILNFELLLKTPLSEGDKNGVCSIEPDDLHRFILPQE